MKTDHQARLTITSLMCEELFQETMAKTATKLIEAIETETLPLEGNVTEALHKLILDSLNETCLQYAELEKQADDPKLREQVEEMLKDVYPANMKKSNEPMQ